MLNTALSFPSFQCHELAPLCFELLRTAVPRRQREGTSLSLCATRFCSSLVLFTFMTGPKISLGWYYLPVIIQGGRDSHAQSIVNLYREVDITQIYKST